MNEPQKDGPESQASESQGAPSAMGEQPTSFRASIIDLVSARTRRAQKKEQELKAAKAKAQARGRAGATTGRGNAKQSGSTAPSSTKFTAARVIQFVVLAAATVYFLKSCNLL